MPRNTGDHFDWMFQISSDPNAGLRTFATSRLPSLSPSSGPADDSFCVDSLEGEWLPDHRSMYLDYEGTVSGQRGRVRRDVWGRFRILVATDDHWSVRLTQWETSRANLDWPDQIELRFTSDRHNRSARLRCVGVR
ncbi:MAG: hypothetical protein AAGJ40_08395 [Planctomycetota bacterium]